MKPRLVKPQWWCWIRQLLPGQSLRSQRQLLPNPWLQHHLLPLSRLSTPWWPTTWPWEAAGRLRTECLRLRRHRRHSCLHRLTMKIHLGSASAVESEGSLTIQRLRLVLEVRVRHLLQHRLRSQVPRLHLRPLLQD